MDQVSAYVCGSIHVETGPFVCKTEGSGVLGCLGCCIFWPINCLIGGTWGTCNYITCGHCER